MQLVAITCFLHYSSPGSAVSKKRVMLFRLTVLAVAAAMAAPRVSAMGDWADKVQDAADSAADAINDAADAIDNADVSDLLDNDYHYDTDWCNDDDCALIRKGVNRWLGIVLGIGITTVLLCIAGCCFCCQGCYWVSWYFFPPIFPFLVSQSWCVSHIPPTHPCFGLWCS